MPELIDCMLLHYRPGVSHFKPSMATRLKLSKITKNVDNFTELGSYYLIQKT